MYEFLFHLILNKNNFKNGYIFLFTKLNGVLLRISIS